MRKKELFPVGDVVPEHGEYECEICKKSGVEVKEDLRKGDIFPKCSSCGTIDVWSKLSFF